MTAGDAGQGDASSVRRRYLLLTATRWLPSGLLIPVFAIAPLERGLSLTEVGVVLAVSSAVVLLLEIPTGGLSDAVGRRPVLLLAAGCSLLSTSALAVAVSVSVYLVAAAVEGVYRALDSGPLDAWYVDTAQAADPGADIERGLAAKDTVLSVAVAVGSLAGGALALLPQPPGLPALALPILVSVALRIVDAAALVALLREAPRRTRTGRRPVGVALDAVRDTSRVVRESAWLLRGSVALLALAGSELLWGAGLASAEIFVPARLRELIGGAEQSVLVFAIAATVGWAASGVGSHASPWVARRTGSWVTAAIVTRTVQAVGILGAGLVAGPVGLLAGYLLFYVTHGAANVAHYGLVNRHVGPEHRTTVLSVNSLTSRLGGVVATPLLGLLGDAAGLPAVFVVSAVLLAAGAPLYVWARPPRR